MKTIAILFITIAATAARASSVEIKDLTCRAYNFMGASVFTLDEKTNFLSTETISLLGITKGSYLLVSVDAEDKLGTTNIPFSKITFHSVAGDMTSSYAMIFTSSLREDQTTYTGTWGQVSFLSPFGGPVGYTPVSQITCNIEVVEEF